MRFPSNVLKEYNSLLKLCLTSVWIKMVLFSKLEEYLAKKCVLHQMCSKNTTRCWKLCLTSFCVKTYLLPNFKDLLLKNAFCMKSAQRIQLAVENCFTSVWVKMFLFFKLEGYLAKKCVFHQICSTNTTRCWKLCFTSVWIKMFLFFKLEGYHAKKMRFPSNVLKEYNSLLKTVLDFILG